MRQTSEHRPKIVSIEEDRDQNFQEETNAAHTLTEVPYPLRRTVLIVHAHLHCRLETSDFYCHHPIQSNKEIEHHLL